MPAGDGILLNGKSDGAEPYKSYGDGAAMRVSLIGAWYSDPDQVVFTAAVSAAASHNHPEGIKGAVVSAACIWMALRGYTKEEICRLSTWNIIVIMNMDLLSFLWMRYAQDTGRKTRFFLHVCSTGCYYLLP